MGTGKLLTFFYNVGKRKSDISENAAVSISRQNDEQIFGSSSFLHLIQFFLIVSKFPAGLELKLRG
jgi:hypothetical protein